jgi:transposase
LRSYPKVVKADSTPKCNCQRQDKQLPLILEDADNALTPLSRELFSEQYQRLAAMDENIKAQDQRISRLCEQHALSKRFREVPGIGPLTATIMALDIGDGKRDTRAVVKYCSGKTAPLSRWLQGLVERRGINKSAESKSQPVS